MKSENFKLVGIEPGKVVFTGLNITIDFRETIPEETLFKLYEAGCPYLKLTTKGKSLFKQRKK